MKINSKKIILLSFITLLFSFIIFKKYKAQDEYYQELYVLQVGAYKNYDNVIKHTRNLENFIVYEEQKIYKIFIGVTLSDEVFNKLKSIYIPDNNVFKKVIKVSNEKFIKNIKSYDEIIMNNDNPKNLNIIIKEELKELNKLLEEK